MIWSDSRFSVFGRGSPAGLVAPSDGDGDLGTKWYNRVTICWEWYGLGLRIHIIGFRGLSWVGCPRSCMELAGVSHWVIFGRLFHVLDGVGILQLTLIHRLEVYQNCFGR
jgi:hypothetical protein